jgi:hypothetical protein
MSTTGDPTEADLPPLRPRRQDIESAATGDRHSLPVMPENLDLSAEPRSWMRALVGV